VHVNLRASRTRIFFDVHRSLGALFFVLLLLATLTGSTLVYLNYVRDIVNVFSKVASFPTVPFRKNDRQESADFGRIIDTVRNAYPKRSIVEIHVPFRQTGGYLFYLKAPGDGIGSGQSHRSIRSRRTSSSSAAIARAPAARR
jgi:hypothetical protein